MPVYRYVNANEEAVFRKFPSKRVPDEISEGGCEYVRDLMGEILSQRSRVKTGNGVGGKPCSTWPRVSEAMGVSSGQVREAMDFDRSRGVPTDYTADGNPILTSKGHQDRYMKVHGFHDRGGKMGADYARKQKEKEQNEGSN